MEPRLDGPAVSRVIAGMTKKNPAAVEHLLMEILADGIDATPLEVLRRAYRAGRESALSDLGRLGGQATSPAKAAAAKRNAKQPRPSAQGRTVGPRKKKTDA